MTVVCISLFNPSILFCVLQPTKPINYERKGTEDIGKNILGLFQVMKDIVLKVNLLVSRFMMVILLMGSKTETVICLAKGHDLKRGGLQ